MTKPPDDPELPGSDLSELRRALDSPPEVAARVARAALRAAPATGLGTDRRWRPVAAVLAFLLLLAAGLYRVRVAPRPASRRPSITNVGDVVIAIKPAGEGGMILRSAVSPAAPASLSSPSASASSTTLIVRYGGTP
jgi:hypothetical protein